MTSTYKFIKLHNIKLFWKRVKHAAKSVVRRGDRSHQVMYTPPVRKYDSAFIDYRMTHHPI